MSVILETSLGEITIDLFTDERPRCCLNFLKLCKIKYYNFCLFYSVQRNLVAQTGDPTGTGKGGESVYGKLYGDQAKFFEMELTPRMKHSRAGLVSMVNNGQNMHGSQFFITLADNLDYLDGKHTVFGEVAEGMDVLMKINEAYCDEDNRPYKDIRIYHTVILDDPYDDPDGLEVPNKSPEPTQEQLDTVRIGADEEIDDYQGMTEEEVKEVLEEKEAKANAQILEMVGDLPDAEVKPEDNVLFVCKLNPVTTDEDLEVIFSRFGTIKSCEVIRDHKTKESLQYAFIEFEKTEDCESAYFKMDNVLIDDRRIHVDFSQSVSKLRYKGKDGQKSDELKEKYIIRDRTTRQDKYDLVFDDDDEGDKKTKSKKKKKHKDRRQSESESDGESHRKKKKERSRSISPQRKNRQSGSPINRSRSPGRRNREDDERGSSKKSKYREDRHREDKYSSTSHRSSERSYEDRDRRSDRDSYRDSERNRDRRRSRERDSYRDRESSRDKYRDRRR
ncbi:peptidyl-prolyl cis-trans isomerase-like 4 isoform X2 [Saccostrea echinata]|uniref:peptidyl-prolyl cis-trans isomerase-like 4 isoform X2 n=1 Tax=Saccostrea echinata TaxID=191078 RepID=UPI002A7F0085|nr:peptidyl-prolyl cis-trans isomerase-like 4 isoform X2 [Saccostrea echinata]